MWYITHAQFGGGKKKEDTNGDESKEVTTPTTAGFDHCIQLVHTYRMMILVLLLFLMIFMTLLRGWTKMKRMMKR